MAGRGDGDLRPRKPHAVLAPYPLQGHVTPMLQLAKILALRGFAITFVNNEFIHHRLLPSVEARWLRYIRFVAIPDGFGSSDSPLLVSSMRERVSAVENLRGPFTELLEKIRDGTVDADPVTCIISDILLYWTQDIADELGIPRIVLWTSSAYSIVPISHMRLLVSRGYLPIKAKQGSSSDKDGENHITDIPGLPSIFKVSDLPTFLQVQNLSEFFWQYLVRAMDLLPRFACILFNSFEELEGPAIRAMGRKTPVLAIGPLLTFAYSGIPDPRNGIRRRKSGTSLWTEDDSCLEWLDMQCPSSVLYISFGSLALQSSKMVEEIALGVEASNVPFLWVMRPNAVDGKPSVVLPDRFLCRTAQRGRVISWAPQLDVLSHSSVGGFLTHCGWNSILESMLMGVPMIGYPYFAEQKMNCILLMQVWGIGIGFPSISDSEIGREEVERAVRTVLTEEEGREMRRKVQEWQETARKATAAEGSSQRSLDTFVEDMMKRMNSIQMQVA